MENVNNLLPCALASPREKEIYMMGVWGNVLIVKLSSCNAS